MRRPVSGQECQRITPVASVNRHALSALFRGSNCSPSVRLFVRRHFGWRLTALLSPATSGSTLTSAHPHAGNAGNAGAAAEDCLPSVGPRHRGFAISQHGADVAEAHECDPQPHAMHHEVDLSFARPNTLAIAEPSLSAPERGLWDCAVCGMRPSRSHANPPGSLIQHAFNRPGIKMF